MSKLKLIVVLAMVLAGVQASRAQELHLRFWQGHWNGENLQITRTVPVTEHRELTETYTVKVPIVEERLVSDPDDPTKEIVRKVTVYRTEERARVRTVAVTREVERVEEFTREAVQRLKLQRASGEKIDVSDLAEVFAKPTTMTEIPRGTELSDAQRAVLRPDVIVSATGKSPDSDPPPLPVEVRATIDDLRIYIDQLSSKINLLQQQIYDGEIQMPDSPEPPPPDVPQPPPVIDPAAP